MCCLHVPVPTFVETRLCNRLLSRLIIPVISNLYRHDSASADENSREGSGIFHPRLDNNRRIHDGVPFLGRNFCSIKICSFPRLIGYDHFINLQFLFKGIRNIEIGWKRGSIHVFLHSKIRIFEQQMILCESLTGISSSALIANHDKE